MKNLIGSVWLLGLLIAVPVVMLVPDLFTKFRVNRIAQETAHSMWNYQVYFIDLNHDGHVQRIDVIRDLFGQMCVQYFNPTCS